MRQTLNITGMKCEGCARNVQKNLESIATVETVTVDLEKQIAYVESQGELSKDRAQESLSATAYQVTGIQ
ncbi:heavy-metal-associated domain-containing protein [Marinilactibacillus sp. Marseille-P9653]|uniref:heavy-metal-associated domain-containing protein n=1 Tax=Marinilactibacillus sp. Marseille-P9653 TaxID=2866583 RepID=UPI001CE4B283|nr:heavy metal-associated domain-containing protein [Marinilactibacillus sp. Marseille-P9653]